MMRNAKWLMGLFLGFLLFACGGSGANYQQTPVPIGDVTDVHQCKVTRDAARPMLVEWPAVEKTALQSRSQNGIVVVRYDGCRLQQLEQCQTAGNYRFTETSRSKDGFYIRDKSELFAKLPLGAVSLEGELNWGRQLSLSYVSVGTRNASIDVLRVDDLKGDCSGATHYVRNMVVGAYSLESYKEKGGSAGVVVGQAGIGGGHESATQVIRSDGDFEACSQRKTDAEDPVCQAIVQLVLEPIEGGALSKERTGRFDKGCGDSPTEMGGQMCMVTSGDFWMGCNNEVDTECSFDENPWGKVNLPDYYFDKNEVTVADYRACVNSGVCNESGVSGDGCNWNSENSDMHPMNCVDWDQAQTYCEWVGKRLPTEAEWEKAARGNDGTKYSWGNELPQKKKKKGKETQQAVANVADEALARLRPDARITVGYDDLFEKTAPVGSFKKGESHWGVLDTLGNVWEWVSDWYDPQYYDQAPSVSPQGPKSGKTKVLRGGSWLADFSNARTTKRFTARPGSRGADIGIRCALDR